MCGLFLPQPGPLEPNTEGTYQASLEHLIVAAGFDAAVLQLES